MCLEDGGKRRRRMARRVLPRQITLSCCERARHLVLFFELVMHERNCAEEVYTCYQKESPCAGKRRKHNHTQRVKVKVRVRISHDNEVSGNSKLSTPFPKTLSYEDMTAGHDSESRALDTAVWQQMPAFDARMKQEREGQSPRYIWEGKEISYLSGGGICSFFAVRNGG